VEIGTGSLGHGLSVGAGMALAARWDGSDRRTVVLLGDGELQEGSVWEAVMFAAQHRLGALTAIVDRNRWQLSGRTEDTVGLEPLADRGGGRPRHHRVTHGPVGTAGPAPGGDRAHGERPWRGVPGRQGDQPL